MIMNGKRPFRTVLLCLIAAALLCACEPAPATEGSENSESTGGESSITTDGESGEPIREAAYMEYEIPDNFNDTYTDVFGITDLKQMRILYNENEGTYCFYYDYPEGGAYMTQLVRKRWGMYMLGAIEHTNASGKKAQIIGASTDFEWVLRCGPTPERSGENRGGNHGDYTRRDWNAEDTSMTNDHFIDMTFYDAATGEKIRPQNGVEMTVNGLRVVIHDNIYDYAYSQNTVLINVERIYLFNGEDVFLHSKLYITRHTYFQMSYTCMMPIMKKYGNWTKFYNVDGTEKLVQTPVVGTSTYGNNFSNGNYATKVEMWGEQEPAYHMTMQIYNPEDQFYQSTDYVKLWDMNPTANKLYFSTFVLGTPTRVRKGTEWDFRSSWSFSYQPDFVSPTEPDEKIGF